MLTVLVSLLVIVMIAIQQAFTILETIRSQGGPIDFRTISNAATRASASFDSLTFNFLFVLIIFCWIIGVVDAYRIGKKKDLEEQPTGHISNRKGN